MSNDQPDKLPPRNRNASFRTPRRAERRKHDRLTHPTVPANVLRSRVLSGQFPIGTRITELTVTEQLGLTRTEIRAGFAVLEREGWVRRVGNVGWIVIGLHNERLDELTSLRVALEVLAVQRCAYLAKQHGTERIEAAFAYLALNCRNRDRLGANTAEADLHREFVTNSRHFLLQQQWSLIDRDVQFLISSATSGIPDAIDGGPVELDAAVLHVQLVDAITSSDPFRAAALVQQQIEERSAQVQRSTNSASAAVN